MCGSCQHHFSNKISKTVIEASMLLTALLHEYIDISSKLSFKGFKIDQSLIEKAWFIQDSYIKSVFNLCLIQ